MANFAPTPQVSVIPQGPLTGPGSSLPRPQTPIVPGKVPPYPAPPWAADAEPGSLLLGGGGWYGGGGGPRIVDAGGGDGSGGPQTTGAIGGGNNLPTLDALLARQKELAGEQSPMGEMISPWQGVAYAADKFMSGLERGRVDRQEVEQRQHLAEIMSGPIGPEQIAQAFAISPEIGVHLLDLEAKKDAVKPQEHWTDIPPPSGENGQWQRNDVDGQTRKVGGGSPGEGGWKPSDLGSLRDDYTKAAGVYETASPSWQSMQEASKIALADPGSDTPGKGAADYNMIVGFAKLLDPQSVVREGEVSSASNLGGMLDTVQGWLNHWKSQGKLDDDVRRAIMTQANSRMKAYYDQAKTKRDWIIGIANRNKVNPDDVVPPLAAFAPWSDGADDDRKYPG
jgi:hypothetical protein